MCEREKTLNPKGVWSSNILKFRRLFVCRLRGKDWEGAAVMDMKPNPNSVRPVYIYIYIYMEEMPDSGRNQPGRSAIHDEHAASQTLRRSTGRTMVYRSVLIAVQTRH